MPKRPGKKPKAPRVPTDDSSKIAGSLSAVRRLSWSQNPLVWALALIVLVALAYQPVWTAGFIWDDDDHVTANPCIIGPLGLKEIWTTDNARYYPLVLTTFWVEHALWGLQALPFHLLNVLLHGVCAIVLWRVLFSLRVPGAWFGAALWVLHPVQVETVAWITELKNIQSCLFYLLSIFCFIRWLRSKTTGRPGGESSVYFLTLLFAALAMASKSAAVVLPFALILGAWWIEGRLAWRTMARIAPTLLLSVIAAALAMWTVDLQGVNADFRWIRTWPERLVTSGNVIWFYLGKLALPHPLIFIYPRWILHAERIMSYLPLAAAAIAMTLFWFNRNTWGRPWLLTFAYFIAALLPVLGLVEHFFLRYSFVADHLQYFADIGPLAFAGAGLTRLSDSLKPALIKWRRPAAAFFLFILGFLSWQRAWAYQTDQSLWLDTVAKNPQCWMAENNLGADLLHASQPEAAIVHYQRAIDIDPTLAEPYYNVGLALALEGRIDEAITQFNRALDLDPALDDARYNLGNALLQNDQTAEAQTQFEKVVAQDSNNAQAHNNLGVCLLRQREREAAIAQFQAALKLAPNNPDAQANLIRAQNLPSDLIR